ncbi:phosphoglycerol transferase I [Flavobacterium sp. MXW15]|uniref:Phosphoglycerol transferase I n=1 Tax=Xanthomonas chitinilytica TaxID=2989819 RepID=A0ABT3JWN1_9XANT|nr:phosphoglycerol transferase I [Xanthomonas sp. H13-6]MCW4455659.1 phosphoglycerol transferase I [Flavobacterium sp. MXW15]MCW4472855.1 phosphoglycerol transferase I [Xanthomonas sp. H13-6]
MPWILWLCLPLLVLLLVASGKWAWLKAGSLSLLLLALSSWWLIDRLSGDGINAATLYHLRSDMEGAGVGDFSGYIVAFLALVLVSLLPLALLRVRRFRRPRHGAAIFGGFAALLATAVLVSPLYSDARRIYQQLKPVDYAQVAPEYQVPTRALAQRKNIVWIYGESLERTYLNEEVFPGLMPNIQRLAGEALDFRGIASADGSGWTIAGLVASMCGVPLTTAQGDENSMGRMGRFLPEAVCLGDYLKQQGYTSHYLGGANGQFAAKGEFLASHGYDEVHDLAYFKERPIAKAHFSNWGLHDDVLLDTAFERFMELSRAGQPFLLTTLTMDTHHPAGHLPVACKRTRYKSEHGNIGLLHALKCSDRLISQLVDRIRSSEFADNTLVVIASDHLAMPNHLSHVLEKQQRENLLLFLDKDIEPRQVVAQAGSTLDSGATLLNLLDPGIAAIGFGRSLLDPDAASASAAAQRDGGKDYPRYLAFARSLWLGDTPRMLRLDGDQVLVGVQQVQPPVLLEYDRQWDLKSVYLENTSKQFESADPEHTLAYVDRCTAFEDGSADGDWCALLVSQDKGIKLYRDAQLRRGIAVDAPLDSFHGPRPSVRQSRMISREARHTHPGQYMLELYARQQPARPFWVEAVSSQRKVVVAQQWVQPDADGRIRMPLGLDHEVDDLEIRAWLSHAEKLAVDDYALVPSEALPDRS